MLVVITGAARGIGLGLSEAFAESGDHVIATCRKPSPELEKLGVEIVEGIELADDNVVDKVRVALGDRKVDALICNAAICIDSHGLEDVKFADLAETFNVNTLGTIRTVLAVLPNMSEGSKIMLISIGGNAFNVGPLPSRGNYGYRMSKAALTSFGFGLARDVADRGIAVCLTAPGTTDTDMVRRAWAEGRTSRKPSDARSPLEVGRLLHDRLMELNMDNSPQWHHLPNGQLVEMSFPYRHASLIEA